MSKLAYSAPTLRKHGSMTALTQQNQSGTFLDVGFTAGTPLDQLTLS
ncbi:hypothetical protein [Aureimonas populi]|uniref:Lasso RiPP family leader peptide-containing protein n=1 Tax=Aureimonas populi TaxID=1701758 RepID=A0ABW5CRD9_9HYPH|nr:hypothetical protein [Aureimonas populi]